MPEHVSLGSKWIGGKMILQPGDTNMSAKEIPIDTFFHKIVMLRDRLRVMEQRINAHDKLTDEDKVNMQQYITKIYGSLTSFNVLFKFPHDQFIGEKSKDWCADVQIGRFADEKRDVERRDDERIWRIKIGSVHFLRVLCEICGKYLLEDC